MSHFLSPIVVDPDGSYRLVNDTAATTLASIIEAAFDSRSRKRGLLGRDGLDRQSAMVLAPCSSIHTFFMRFPIDVVFVTGDGTVRRICHRVRPGHIAFAFGAFAAIELAAGVAEASGLSPGHQLRVVAGSESSASCQEPHRSAPAATPPSQPAIDCSSDLNTSAARFVSGAGSSPRPVSRLVPSRKLESGQLAGESPCAR